MRLQTTVDELVNQWPPTQSLLSWINIITKTVLRSQFSVSSKFERAQTSKSNLCSKIVESMIFSFKHMNHELQV